MAIVDTYILSGQIDSAYTVLQDIIKDTPDQNTYDSALSLQLQIQRIILLDIPGKQTDALLELSAAEYELLQSNQLEKQFLSNPRLNNYYLQKLHKANEQSQSVTVTQENSNAENRRNYAEDLLKSYNELGFEISIQVSGDENENMTLKSPVFNDEWFTKFATGGDLEAWHAIGFKKIQIEDGSSYIRTKEWAD